MPRKQETDKSKPSRGEDNAEWEAHKETLRKMYVEEDLPLREVLTRMAEEHGFIRSPKQCTLQHHARKRAMQSTLCKYRLQTIWQWRKYNQIHAEAAPVADVPDEPDTETPVFSIPGITVSETSPADDDVPEDIDHKVFHSVDDDSKILDELRRTDSANVSAGLWLCFEWCKQELLRPGAERSIYLSTTPRTIAHAVMQQYYLEISLFIHLFKCYVAAPPENQWDKTVKSATSLEPAMALFTMGSLVLSMAANQWRAIEATNDSPPPPPDTVLTAAKLGLELMETDEFRWSDEELIIEFCNELSAIVDNYRPLGAAVAGAVLSMNRVN
ncbi:hypothetical protein GGS20DRAFT_598773 [Poronia punctata]|nr:hypothetical protein GGS20DRAFT_598773 [Poronia punctata]